MLTMREFGQVFARGFHSTPVACAKHSKRRLETMMRNIPRYPHPVPHTFKQSWFGLYGGKHIQFGNNVPESEYKTRRYWLPNIRHKKLYSHALNDWVDLTVTANVLRKPDRVKIWHGDGLTSRAGTVDKAGGLDNYLLGSKTARLKELGPMGWKLRWRIMNTLWYKGRQATEREGLGLPQVPEKLEAEPKEEVTVKVTGG
jgi:large subunit ribosomal protein L28